MNDKIKDIIQDCNMNFLLGSGLSSPYLKTLGNIEILLTQLEETSISEEQKSVLRCSIYKKYFDGAISHNSKILNSDPEAKEVLNDYQNFLKVVNSILLKRKSTILSKQVNVFTTNIDIFTEMALEDIGLEYNDGFNGRFNPIFSLTNFKKSHFKKSLHYDNTSEIPVFNLLKLHGSVSWEMNGTDGIKFACDLANVNEVQLKTIANEHIADFSDDVTIETLVAKSTEMKMNASLKAFLEAYEKLLIVNPTKEKFKHTLLNQTYYELLRIYSNELEKENTVLFVMGFSFADEHILEITLRAANSNPTLIIYIMAHDSKAKQEIEGRFQFKSITNNNVQVITPTQKNKSGVGEPAEESKYTLATITKDIFFPVLEREEIEDIYQNMDPEQPIES
jgi:hypothetical protein